MPPANEPTTICGYRLSDVRRALRNMIDLRDRRGAARWTAELVATPAAVGSLWASYWLAWATAQGAGSASPTTPILLRQTWSEITSVAEGHSAVAGNGPELWAAFRNDPDVRLMTSEMTERMLNQPRQTPVVWPSKEVTLHDVEAMRAVNPPATTDGKIVLATWQRDEDGMELRMMAGRWIDAMQRGDLRAALSAMAWTLMTPAQQGANPLVCAARGPLALTAKQRASPVWFWLALGRELLAQRTRDEGLHRGWSTMHAAVAEAFKLHFKRWSAAERMRVLLAWNLQIRASFLPQPDSLWVAPPLQLTAATVDLPYKEIAAELADPEADVIQQQKAPTAKQLEKDSKAASLSRMEAKMAEADAAVLAAMGFDDDEI